MGKRREEEENHWPGFVDALSTIIMVVTFLLIILGIVIFVLSQKVAEEHRSVLEQLVEAELRAKDKEVAQLKNELAALEGFSTMTSINGSNAIVRQDEAVEGEIQLALKSARIKREELAQVQALEDDPDKAVNVTTAATAITLDFDSNVVDLTEDATNLILDFSSEFAEQLEGRQIELWSYAESDVASFSEARRVAYYRAIAVRNVLLESGLPAENIVSKIRETDPSDSGNKVHVIVK